MDKNIFTQLNNKFGKKIVKLPLHVPVAVKVLKSSSLNDEHVEHTRPRFALHLKNTFYESYNAICRL